MEQILSSFQKLHMPGMASCWKIINETHQTNKLTLKDGLELLLQSELDNRQNNRIERLIKKATFKQMATIEELDKNESRGISAGTITQLSTGEYLKNGSLPPEYYYKTCDMMLRLQRDNQPQFFDQACEICIENHLFTGKRLENVIKTLAKCSHEPSFTSTPTPKDHANMRGNLFFQ